MLRPQAPAYADIEVKQSKFLAHLVPSDSFKKVLKSLQNEHPKARHFIVASRSFNEHFHVLEYATDDGEPKGTAGKPTLNVMRGAELIECALIIVRYFGGTKLGTGGLVRAYTDAAKAVIQASTLKPYEMTSQLRLIASYTHCAKVEYLLEMQHIITLEKVYQTQEVLFITEVTATQKAALIEAIKSRIFRFD